MAKPLSVRDPEGDHPRGQRQLDVHSSDFSCLADILGAMREGLLVRDPSGVIVVANASAAALLERSEPQLVGRKLQALELNLLHEDGAPVLRGEMPFEKALAAGSLIRDDILGLVLSDGRIRWLKVSSTPASMPGGTGAITIFSDVTDERVARRALASMTADLEKLVRTRTDDLEAAIAETRRISLAIANDLRAPIHNIGSHISILESYLGDNPQAQGSLSRLKSLVQSMDDFSNAAHELAKLPDHHLSQQSCDLAMLCRSTAKDFCDTTGHSVACSFGKISKVAVDPQLIRTALTMIISMAGDAGQGDEPIRITSSENDYAVTFAIRASTRAGSNLLIGVGGPAGRGQNIHEELAGVRMLLVRKISDLHDGAFWLEDSVGEVAFLLTLPKFQVALAA